MTEQAALPVPDAPPWHGFHHLALLTPDLDATLAFYQDVLGMAVLGPLPGNPLHGRHALVRVGEPTPGGLHFFEVPGAHIPTYPLERGLAFPVDFGALHHISLALPDEAAGLALRERLSRFGVTMTPVLPQGDVNITLFPDNNGMFLEAAWPRTR
ncbi:VOC family protein [Deinococcus aluminii]|uniref:VOC domain-containing protein n=1 Tax=Deinococcus aluminii TaxID=1656885 RepID=A0ABP9XAX2_9DEIO